MQTGTAQGEGLGGGGALVPPLLCCNGKFTKCAANILVSVICEDFDVVD